ncbi:MAG TPA: hypothetical protein VFN26_22800 [Candidatus Acidoferrum sp.]|nr:hypothetical protein [Candidatus Acidoferrum sp.]
MTRKIGLRSLKNLCTFFGAIALFSYFYNWTVDLRHWYVTVASAFVCSILWLGFYMLEVHKDRVTSLSLAVKRVALKWLSDLRSRPELPSPTGELPALPADPPARVVGPEVTRTTPNPLPWLRPRPPQVAIAEKK